MSERADQIKQRLAAWLSPIALAGPVDLTVVNLLRDSRALIEELERQNKALDIRCSEMMEERESLRSRIGVLEDLLAGSTQSESSPPCKVCHAPIAKLYAPGGWLCDECRREDK